MPVRWMAVVTGFTVDIVISALLSLVISPDETFAIAPDPSNPSHLLFMILALLSTGVGGFVAARMAHERFELHGLLVGVLGILFSQIAIMAGAPPLPHLLVALSALGCVLGALGGAAARIAAHISASRKL